MRPADKSAQTRQTRRWLFAGGMALFALLLTAPAAAQNIREKLKKAPEPKLTKAPKLLKFVEAIYPKEAAAKKIGGKVQLSVTIDAKGMVSAVKVVKAPDASLGVAAEEAVRKFVFSPAEVDNKPAPVVIRYDYNFVLEKEFVPRVPDWVTGKGPPPSGNDVLIGQVREGGSRLPLAGVAVAVMEAGIEVKTDDRGRFRVRDLPPGTYRVQAISLQHKRETVKIEVREGAQSRIKFYLPPLTRDQYETVVRGKRRQTSVTRVALRGRQLTTVPGTFGDPIRVVENLPGVARVPYVGGALLIRGAAPGDSGTFFDGVRIPILFHFFGGPSVVNGEFLKRIDYYPGNADSRYGRLTAGVVDVASQDQFNEEWHGSFDINLLNIGLYLNAPITKNITISGAIRRSYIDALLPLVFKAADVNATTVVPVYYDYQLKVDAKIGGDDRLSVLFFGSDDDLRVVSNEADSDFGIDLGSKTSFHRILGLWTKYFAKGRGVSRLKPWVGYDLISFDTTGANIAITSWLAGLREDLEYRLSKHVRLRAGADTEIQVANFSANVPLPPPWRNPSLPPFSPQDIASAPTQKVDVTQTIGSIGLYVDAIINVTPKLQLIPGVRFDLFFYQQDNIRPDLGPRLTARYRLFKDTTLKAAAGLYSRAPGPNQTNKISGNPNMVLEHAGHFAVGVEIQKLWLDALSLDAQVYYLHRYDQAVRSREVVTTGTGIDSRNFDNTGTGYSTGLELILKHDVTRHFYGWIAYTLAISKQQLVSGGETVRFPFDQRHILTAVGSVRLGTGWEVGLRFRLVTGRPETPVLDGVFDSDSLAYAQVFGERNSVSRATFHQLDLRVEKTWIFKLWRLSVYLDIQNIYNAENPEATFYDYRFRESGPLRGLPFLPTFGVKGSF